MRVKILKECQEFVVMNQIDDIDKINNNSNIKTEENN